MPNRFAMLPIEVISDKRLSVNDFRVYAALCSFAGGKGTCHPKRETLAERSGLTARKVSAATARLCQFGWIQKRGNGGRNSPAIYTLTTPKTLPETGTVLDQETLPKTGRVIDKETLPETGTKTLPETGRGKEKTKEKKKEKVKKEKEKWQTPEWINPQAWAEFEQHRQEIRKPLSNMARTKAANALQNLTHEQQARCIDMTIQNHWQGLFPEKVIHEARQRNQTGQPADFFEDCKAYAARKMDCGTVRQAAIPIRPYLVTAVDDD